MKSIFLCIFCLLLAVPCIAAREKGKAHDGYSCKESLPQYISSCFSETFTKEQILKEMNICEITLATSPCDNEYADLLWCYGRTFIGANNGCDCAVVNAAFKKCQYSSYLSNSPPLSVLK